MANAGARSTWIQSTIWNKPWFRAWKRGGKLLWFHFTTCAEGTIAGIFQMDPDVVRMKTGPWRQAEWERDTAAMHPHIIFYPDNWVFIAGYLEHNTRGINVKLADGIARVVNAAPEQVRADFMVRYERLLGVYAMGIETPLRPPSNPSDDILPSPPHPTPTQPITAIPRSASGGRRKKLSQERGMWVKEACAAFLDAAQTHMTVAGQAPAEPEGYNKGVLEGLFKRRILKGDDLSDLLGAIKAFAGRKTAFDKRTGHTSGFSSKDLAGATTWDSCQREYRELREAQKRRGT